MEKTEEGESQPIIRCKVCNAPVIYTRTGRMVCSVDASHKGLIFPTYQQLKLF